MSEIQMESSWKNVLQPEFDADYMKNLYSFLAERKNAGATIFPPEPDVFNAFNATPFDDVKVVIIGQDPYHGAGQAHGLCFSVQPDVRIPPSLKNIYKELATDIAGFEIPNHGFLQKWAEQGVLLLNSVLSVEEGLAGAHQKKGWERFTDAAIAHLSKERAGIVFMLWGAYAHKKGAVVDASKHLVLETVHPSPLSARRGFFGCKHFSQANDYLKAQGKTPIDWQV